MGKEEEEGEAAEDEEIMSIAVTLCKINSNNISYGAPLLFPM
jgi:hypothetical protein